MNKLIKHITAVNKIYHSMKKNYDTLKKMFKNHSSIKQKVILSEQILHQAFILIAEKTEEAETKREFNKIVKGLKNEKEKR